MKLCVDRSLLDSVTHEAPVIIPHGSRHLASIHQRHLTTCILCEGASCHDDSVTGSAHCFLLPLLRRGLNWFIGCALFKSASIIPVLPPVSSGKRSGKHSGRAYFTPPSIEKKKSGTPCVSKRFRYMRKFFKKICAFPKDFPNNLTSYANAYLVGHIRRISTGNPHLPHSHH